MNQGLHDIDGIDPISLWPLALGWWLCIALVFFALIMVSWWLYRHLQFKRSWKYDALTKINALDATNGDVILLAAYLRRIVLQRFPRGECARLFGEAWLQWLQKNDPKQFDWTLHGKVLVEAPYAPEGKLSTFNQENFRLLLKATQEWVN